MHHHHVIMNATSAPNDLHNLPLPSPHNGYLSGSEEEEEEEEEVY
jgi:hypothetical protein